VPHFRVDDALHSHPKAQRAGDDALGMWSRAGSYCMAYLTDGFVPDWWVKQQPKGIAKAKRLVAAGLWLDGAERDGEKGWQFHEFTGIGRQDSRAQILAEREKWRKKKAAQRGDTSGDSLPESLMESRVESPGDTRGESTEESPYVRATPARANPTQPNKEISGQVFEAARPSDASDGIAATIGAKLLDDAGIDPSLPDAPRLRLIVNELVGTGSAPADVTQGLRDWNSRTGIGPGVLRSLVSDVVKLRNGHVTNGHGTPKPAASDAAFAAAQALKTHPSTRLEIES
jgi:hypothetical protein